MTSFLNKKKMHRVGLQDTQNLLVSQKSYIPFRNIGIGLAKVWNWTRNAVTQFPILAAWLQAYTLSTHFASKIEMDKTKYSVPTFQQNNHTTKQNLRNTVFWISPSEFEHSVLSKLIKFSHREICRALWVSF